MKNKEIIQAARDCFDDFEERESDNLSRARGAIEFRSLNQWPDAIKRDRENKNQDGGSRPCPVLDKTNQYVRLIVNEERQNRAAIKIRPVDDKADKRVAEVYTGIIRHIEESSNALTAYSTAGEHAIDGGFGYFRIIADYCDPLSFEQDIKIKRIPNRFSVALGRHNEPDASDCTQGLVWEDVDKETLKAEYPKAKMNGFEAGDEWVTDDTIRVAEYMWIEEDKITIHLMPDGSVMEGDEMEGATASRTTMKRTVKWAKITGTEVLEERDMLGSYIPIIKVIGNEIFMPDGTQRLSGLVEDMMESQRLHNYAHAGFIEHVALAPRAPWIAEETQIEGYEEDYADANRKNIAVLKYKASADSTGQALPMPQRLSPPGVATGWQQVLQNTEHGIEAAIGMYGPSVGAKSQEKSGIALQEQKTQGMTVNYHFPDNLARSIQHAGRIMVEWIPGIYDTQRVARMLGEDDIPENAYLNPDQEEAVSDRMDKFGQRIGESYNLNVGKYDVTVSTGPSYTSKRQEAFANRTQLLKGNPEMMAIIGDLVFESDDTPGSDKIAERLKLTLPPEIKQAEQQKDSGDDPKALMQQAMQAQQMLDQQQQMMQQQGQELQQLQQDAMAAKADADAAITQLNAERKIFMAEQKTVQAQIDLELMRLENAGKQAQGQAADPKIALEREKIHADMIKHDREMALKEAQSGLIIDGKVAAVTQDQVAQNNEVIKDIIDQLGGEIVELKERASKKKIITVQRGPDGKIAQIEEV